MKHLGDMLSEFFRIYPARRRESSRNAIYKAETEGEGACDGLDFEPERLICEESVRKR
jgi:hypothetical protein